MTHVLSFIFCFLLGVGGGHMAKGARVKPSHPEPSNGTDPNFKLTPEERAKLQGDEHA